MEYTSNYYERRTKRSQHDATRWSLETLYLSNKRSQLVFKIEVFDAFYTRFGPSKYIYLSQNNFSKRNPKLKMMKTLSLEVLNMICPSQELTRVGHCHYKKWS